MQHDRVDGAGAADPAVQSVQPSVRAGHHGRHVAHRETRHPATARQHRGRGELALVGYSTISNILL